MDQDIILKTVKEYFPDLPIVPKTRYAKNDTFRSNSKNIKSVKGLSWFYNELRKNTIKKIILKKIEDEYMFLVYFIDGKVYLTFFASSLVLAAWVFKKFKNDFFPKCSIIYNKLENANAIASILYNSKVLIKIEKENSLSVELTATNNKSD